MSIRPLGPNDPFSFLNHLNINEQASPADTPALGEPSAIRLPLPSGSDDFSASMMRYRVQSLTVQDVQTEADQLVAQHTRFFNLDENGLGRDLAARLAEQPELVQAVFGKLSASDRAEVARAMFGAVRDADLQSIAWSDAGRGLLFQIKRDLENNSLTGDGLRNRQTDRVIMQRIDRAFAESVRLVEVEPQPQPPWTREGKPPRVLSGNEIPEGGDASISVELPESGKGYVTYNRNDTPKWYEYSLDPAKPKERPRMPDQIGTRETIERIQALGREWYARHPDRPLQIGDMSLPGGVKTPQHATHRDGLVFDMRPLRKDDKWGTGANVPHYNNPDHDRELTKDFIRMVVQKYPGTKIYFNDEKIYKDPEFKGVVSPKGGHNDHLHVMFPGAEGNQ